jgi:putative tryptophan/tyrosine transport system substrate-binding protein
VDRRAFVAGTLGFLAAPLGAEAQQGDKIYRIGVLSGASAPDPVTHPAFVKALQELGYVPRQNLIFEERYAGGTERLPALAAELVGLNMDIIATIGTPAARAAKAATSTIPVMFVIQANPVERGLVASLARPGGNLTGVTAAPVEIDDKRLELLKQAVPRALRLAYLRDANYGPATWVASWAAPRSLGLQVQLLEVKGPGDFAGALEAAIKGRADILFIEESPLTDVHFRDLASLAVKSRLPGIAAPRSFAEAGLLMTYGVDGVALSKLRAVYVDRILKGAKPADLPVEQNSKFEFVINLKTAKALGLTIPPAVLARADEVIQ